MAWLFYLETIGIRRLDHDLMATASIWEKSISILAGNLNSGRSYHIATVKRIETDICT